MAVFCPFVSSLVTSYLTFLFQDTHFKTFPKLSFIFDDNLLFRTFRIQKIYVIWQMPLLELTWSSDQFRKKNLPSPKFALTIVSPSSEFVSHPYCFPLLTSPQPYFKSSLRRNELDFKFLPQLKRAVQRAEVDHLLLVHKSVQWPHSIWSGVLTLTLTRSVSNSMVPFGLSKWNIFLRDHKYHSQINILYFVGR